MRFGQQFRTFNSIAEGDRLLPEALLAHISLIPKEGKDPLQCQNYRPISLINTDLKLFAKALSARLGPLLDSLVHPDQVGFMPGREAKDNTTRVIYLIHAARSGASPLLLLSTDAEKAFDRVDWSFLRLTLRHVGMGERMMQWIGALYSTPSASVRVNECLSSPFPITNGTRQGCPLSPLIFILTLEPFLRHVRANSDIRGLDFPHHHHKVAAYADDLLFSLTSPEVSLPCLLTELDRFGNLSNFKINMQKSEALNVSIPQRRLNALMPNFSFRWASSHITYLGVKLSADLTRLFDLNFPPLLKTIRADLKRWDRDIFTWFGRVSILKMNVLPRILYLLQTLPVAIPSSFFASLKGAFSSFVWARRGARIGRHVLTLPKPSGGLALPDISRYHRAVHMARLVDWCTGSSAKLWVQLEQEPFSFLLPGLPWVRGVVPLSARLHPTVGQTLRICAATFSDTSLSPLPSPMTPIIGNPLFPPGLEEGVLGRFRATGSFRAMHFATRSGWRDLSALRRLSSPPLPYWTCLQLRHFLTSLSLDGDYCRDLTPFERLCISPSPVRHSLSLIYSMLSDPGPDYCPAFIHKWERDLDVVFSPDQVKRILHFSHKSSISCRYQEMSYKLVSRWYRTPSLLHKIFPQVPDSCWRCGEPGGTLVHIFLSCPVLSGFWASVTSIATSLTGVPLLGDPAACLLHLAPISSKRYKRSLLVHLLSAAKACIAAAWKQTSPPSISQWFSRINDIQHMEDLTASLRHNSEGFIQTWLRWTEFKGSPDYLATQSSVLTPG